jgi:hypothetical protein
MDGHIFDGLITGLLLSGIAIGLALAGVIWGLVSLAHHIHIVWSWL